MTWNSLHDFVNMGGYGVYVWGSYGACLGLFLLESLQCLHRRRQALRAVRRELEA